MTEQEIERLLEQQAEKAREHTFAEEMPELTAFSGLVKATRARMKRRQNLQFAIFIAVAVLVAGILIVCAVSSFAIVGILQGAALALFLLIQFAAHLRRRQRKRVREAKL